MHCCLQCGQHECSPDYHIDLDIQHLVVFRTIYLLLYIREYFLMVWSVDLQTVDLVSASRFCTFAIGFAMLER